MPPPTRGSCPRPVPCACRSHSPKVLVYCPPHCPASPLPLPHSALHAARCSPPPPLLRSPRYSFPLCMHVLSMYCTNITLRCVSLRCVAFVCCTASTRRDATPPTWTLGTRARVLVRLLMSFVFHLSSHLSSFALLSSRFPRRVASPRIELDACRCCCAMQTASSCAHIHFTLHSYARAIFEQSNEGLRSSLLSIIASLVRFVLSRSIFPLSIRTASVHSPKLHILCNIKFISHELHPFCRTLSL